MIDLWEFWGERDAKAQTAAWGILYYNNYVLSLLLLLRTNTKIYKGLYIACVFKLL